MAWRRARRGKGYGRQIMLFGLKTLKKEGRAKAHLSVHVDNETVIHLYRTMGFSITEQNKHLFWNK